MLTIRASWICNRVKDCPKAIDYDDVSLPGFDDGLVCCHSIPHQRELDSFGTKYCNEYTMFCQRGLKTVTCVLHSVANYPYEIQEENLE